MLLTLEMLNKLLEDKSSSYPNTKGLEIVSAIRGQRLVKPAEPAEHVDPVALLLPLDTVIATARLNNGGTFDIRYGLLLRAIAEVITGKDRNFNAAAKLVINKLENGEVHELVAWAACIARMDELKSQLAKDKGNEKLKEAIAQLQSRKAQTTAAKQAELSVWAKKFRVVPNTRGIYLDAMEELEMLKLIKNELEGNPGDLSDGSFAWLKRRCAESKTSIHSYKQGSQVSWSKGKGCESKGQSCESKEKPNGQGSVVDELPAEFSEYERVQYALLMKLLGPAKSIDPEDSKKPAKQSNRGGPSDKPSKLAGLEHQHGELTQLLDFCKLHDNAKAIELIEKKLSNLAKTIEGTKNKITQVLDDWKANRTPIPERFKKTRPAVAAESAEPAAAESAAVEPAAAESAAVESAAVESAAVESAAVAV